MNQNHISVESLAANEHFQEFCLQPNTENREFWDSWQKKNSQYQTIFGEAKALVKHLALQPTDKEVSQELARLKQGLLKAKRPTPKLAWRRNLLRVAAVFLVLITAFGIWKSFSIQEVNWQTYQTNFGKTQKIDLADGSVIQLNAAGSSRTPGRGTGGSPLPGHAPRTG